MFRKLGHNIIASKFKEILGETLPPIPRQVKGIITKSQKRSKSQFNTPHPPKDPPENFQPTVVHVGFEPPDCLPYAVFRPFETPSDPLGPGAHKCNTYKNAEYYSYHRYSFAEIQYNSVLLRQKGIESGGTHCVYDCEGNSSEEDNSSCKTSSSSDDSDRDDTNTK